MVHVNFWLMLRLPFYLTNRITKHMVMSRDQNAGRSRVIKNDNSSFERVEEFKCL